MLQQTPVRRVLPTYTRWLARWPTAADLAAASAGEAVREWGGLGYPRRALHLHAVARSTGRRRARADGARARFGQPGRRRSARGPHRRPPRGRQPDAELRQLLR